MIVHPNFRSRPLVSVLIMLTFIWVFLWRFGDYGYTLRNESLVVPTVPPTNESWDRSLAAEGSSNEGVERNWRNDGGRVSGQRDALKAQMACQRPIVNDDEQRKTARIAELELMVEKERQRREKESMQWSKSSVLNGLPTERFRDNLRNDTYYLTSWASAGFTNEFMGFVNMIYLATLTDRIPILPPFAPDHHITAKAGIVPFGDIFDLELLSSHLRIPILEWRDVKQIPERSDPNPYPFQPNAVDYPSEEIGCWTTRPADANEPTRAEHIVYHIGLDVSYTRVPYSMRYQATRDPKEIHINFPHLAALIYRSKGFSSSEQSDIAPSWVPFPDPERERNRYDEMSVSPMGHHRGPEAHLSCFDMMYYMSSGAELYEWRFGFSPAWRTVGRHLRFSQKMENMTKEYLDVLFGRAAEDEVGGVPPFIAVHIRRGDFNDKCNGGTCLASLLVYQKYVDEVKHDLREKRGVEVDRVVVMSDESSEDFWTEVKSLGWLSIDHHAHQTFERFGEWFPPLIDIVIQSYAVGFVGTEDSTFSMVSQKRVIDWNDGFVRSVGLWVK